MERTKWTVERRSATGKGVARKLRAAGKLPGNVFGKGLENISLTVDREKVNELIHAGNWNQVLIELSGEGLEPLRDKVFMIRELQRHHVTRQPLTIDFHMVRLDKKITIDVPLVFHGGEEVKKTGAVLDVQTRTLALKCLPTEIPAQIEIDASKLQVGQTLHLSDITLPAGTETDLPPGYPICTAAITRAGLEETAAPAGEAAPGEAKTDKTSAE